MSDIKQKLYFTKEVFMSHKQYVAVVVPGASDGPVAKAIAKVLPIWLGDDFHDYKMMSQHELIDGILQREPIVGVVAMHNDKYNKIENPLRHDLHHKGIKHIANLPACVDFHTSDPIANVAEVIKKMVSGQYQAPTKSEVLACNITQPNLALMRHATFEEYDNKILNEEQVVCRRMVRQLAERVAGKKVLIYHSPLERATQTARIVRHELIDCGIFVSKMEILSQLEIEKGNIHRAVAMVNDQLQSDENFVLFISHEPEILMFIGRSKGFNNCSIIARDFELVRPDH